MKKNNFKIEIIDNFLNKNDFDQLCQLKLDYIKDGIKVYHSKISKNNEIEEDFIEKNLLKKLHEKYHEKKTSPNRFRCR